jgi:hypothetical protein
MRIPLKWGCIAAVALLGGCGNAYDKITVGEWEAVGKPVAPQPAPKNPYVVEVIEAGAGPVVSAGDLVKAHLTILTARNGGPTSQDVWVWVGHEPVVDPEASGRTSGEFSSLGTPRFRRALIGRQLNEKFDLRGVSERLANDEVPLHVLRSGNLPYNRLTEVIVDGQLMNSPEWPSVEIPLPQGEPEVVARVQILEVCKAKLFRRTALVRQWGIMFGFADVDPDFSRHGYLGWSKIDAQCPGARGHFTVQAGPFYKQEPGDASALFSWARSYTSLRRPPKFPEEWSADPARAGLK